MASMRDNWSPIAYQLMAVLTMRKRSLVIVFAMCCQLAIPSWAQSCDKLTNKSAEPLSYLENYPKQDFGQECVAFAIKALSYHRKDERAAHILVKYLDYYWKEPGCEHIGGGRCMRGPYPATESLMEIGRVSIPYILQAIKSETTSEVSRKNALEVWSYFTRDDVVDGIATLKREADQTSDPKEKEHLLWAATTEADHSCFRDQRINRSKCERALRSGVSFVPEEAEYEIYSSAIQKESNGWFFDKYSITAHTVSTGWDKPASTAKGCEYVDGKGEDDDEYDSAFADFESKNTTSERLHSGKLNLPKPYMLLSEEQSKQLRRSLPIRQGTAPGAMADRDYIAGSLISVSRVGFSKNGRIAVVYVQHECGPSCVSGGIHVFRHDNAWFENIVCYR